MQYVNQQVLERVQFSVRVCNIKYGTPAERKRFEAGRKRVQSEGFGMQTHLPLVLVGKQAAWSAKDLECLELLGSIVKPDAFEGPQLSTAAAPARFARGLLGVGAAVRTRVEPFRCPGPLASCNLAAGTYQSRGSLGFKYSGRASFSECWISNVPRAKRQGAA